MTKCPRCQATTHQNKAGQSRAGSQRYRCKHCGLKYIPESKHRGHVESIDEKAIEEPYAEGEKLRPVAPQVEVAPQSVSPGSFAKAENISKVGVALVSNEIIPVLKPVPVAAEIQMAVPLVLVLPVAASRPLLPAVAASAHTESRWGQLPEIALLQSCSLFLLAWTFVWARAGSAWSEMFFWIGLAVLIVPVAIRLYSTLTPRHERIALILLLGASLYLVKVMHSPYDYTFTDEFNTIRNVREILENQRLFEQNPGLPVTALYPGLATITSLLVSLSGLSTFAAGLLVIGAARFVLFLALFLLYEQVSGSARIGGLATLFYMANANFLFFTADFAYEALALPIAILVLYIVARREMTNDYRIAFTVVATLGIFMVVISHHMTSYILTGLLFVATGISILRTRGRQRAPWDLAIIAALAISFWILYVAAFTIHYLSPVLWNAVNSIIRLTMQEETGRQLFKSTSTAGGYVTPLWIQLTMIGSVMIIALGLPIGWLSIWRRFRHQIFFLLLGVISLGYLPMQGLRLTSAGWETANRSSEFLFIGVAFVLALAIEHIWRLAWDVKSIFEKFVPSGLRRFRINISGRDGVRRLQSFVTKLSSWIQWKFAWIYAPIMVVLILGGFMSGWPPQTRMPRPYLVAAGSHIVEPQSVEVAKWTFDHLGPDHHIATGKVGSKLLTAYGEQVPFTGSAYGIQDLWFSAVVSSSERGIISYAGINYIAYDRRRISWDDMIGLYFSNQKSSPSYELVELETYNKFDGLKGVNRILDSGDIAIYDVRVYLETNDPSRPQSTTGSQPMRAVEMHVEQPASVNKATIDQEHEVSPQVPVSTQPQTHK
jgi:hypothetical protein